MLIMLSSGEKYFKISMKINIELNRRRQSEIE